MTEAIVSPAADESFHSCVKHVCIIDDRLATLAPFDVTFRAMRNSWRTPVRMTNAGLVDTLGHEPRTPLDDAIEARLVGLGCVKYAMYRDTK
ncbi:hypothetical protein BURKHO8Y_120030 [Burkholderia sp. 8Y]|nr:hypothetical protein BURKHO8Y_120030 [Burkholderia sp. 8Y]